MIKQVIIFFLAFFVGVALHAELSKLTQEQMKKPLEKEIRFYYPTMPYFEFTNFWASPFTLDGKVWPTSEHYYQAQKFIGENIGLQEEIRKLQTPDDVFRAANTFNGKYKDKIRKDWNDILVDVMRNAVKAKFAQHPELMDLLKSTKDSLLIEQSDKDGFWGIGNKTRDGFTEVTPLNNWLGKILTEVRDGKKLYIYNPKDY